MTNHLDQLAKATPSVRAVYAALLKAGRALGPVREAPRQTSIHLMRETTFAGVTVRRASLILTLKSNDAIDSERVAKTQQASARRWYNEIRLASPREVDAELRAWMAASYALSGKPRTRPSVPAGHSDIDEYLAQLPPAKRAGLQKLRRAIHAAVPGAEECISYQMPAFRKDGKVFAWFGAGANHLALYPGAASIKLLKNELVKYETSKGTVRFPIDKPLPAALVKKLVTASVASPRRRRGANAARSTRS
ncbi:MAG TPA: DUF5655 domain-containing protein [Candidatus Krumholzibacteria bacterium]|nr:DUF5655 domain-containing protein [Candidatus Krumholzibacteria bacterium]